MACMQHAGRALNVMQDAAGRQGADALRKQSYPYNNKVAKARWGCGMWGWGGRSRGPPLQATSSHTHALQTAACVLHNTQSREATGKMLNSSSRNLSALVIQMCPPAIAMWSSA
eukprot:scaffold6068_cov119-Isochrysis_galbana.AAC.11